MKSYILDRNLERRILINREKINEKNIEFSNSHEFVYVLSHYGRAKFGLYSGDLKIFKDNIVRLDLNSRGELFEYYCEHFNSFAVFYDIHIEIMETFNLGSLEYLLDKGLEKNNIYFNRLCMEISVIISKMTQEEAFNYAIDKNSTYLFEAVGESVKKKFLIENGIPIEFKQYAKEHVLIKKGNSYDEEALKAIQEENEEYLSDETKVREIEKTVEYVTRNETLWKYQISAIKLLEEGYISDEVFSSRIFNFNTKKRHLCNFPLKYAWLYGIIHEDYAISEYFNQYKFELSG